MWTISTNKERRVDSKPAAYVLQDTELGQRLIGHTEQTTQRLLSKEMPLWPSKPTANKPQAVPHKS